MDDVFNSLKKNGQTSVDDLMVWLKNSKIVGESKEAEEAARKLFADVKNKADVDLPQFKKVVTTLAEQQKTNLNVLADRLAKEGPKLAGALQAGISAIKDALK